MRFADTIGAGVLLLGLVGCSTVPVNETHDGTLADSDVDHGGHKCDAYPISVGARWDVDVRMESDWDNYLHLALEGEDVETNDDGDRGLNAHLEHTTMEGGSYTVFACAFAEGRGPYTLSIVTSEGN